MSEIQTIGRDLRSQVQGMTGNFLLICFLYIIIYDIYNFMYIYIYIYKLSIFRFGVFL